MTFAMPLVVPFQSTRTPEGMRDVRVNSATTANCLFQSTRTQGMREPGV